MSSRRRKRGSQIRVIHFSRIRPNIAVAAGGEEVKLIEFRAEADPDGDDPDTPSVLRHVVGSCPMPRRFIVSSAAFSPFEETELAIGTLSGHVIVFDINKAMELEKAKYVHIERSEKKVYSLDWGPGLGGKVSAVYAVTSDGEVNVHVPEEKKKIPFSELCSSSSPKNALKGKRLEEKASKTVISWFKSFVRVAIADSDGTIEIYSHEAGHKLEVETTVSHPHKSPVTCVKWLSEDVIVASFNDPTILLFNLQNNQVVGRLEGHKNPVTSLSVSGAKNVVSASSDESSAHVYHLDLDMKTCKVFHPVIIKDHQVRLFAVSIAPFNCNVIVSGGLDGEVHVWKLDEQTRIPLDHSCSTLGNGGSQVVSSSSPRTGTNRGSVGTNPDSVGTNRGSVGTNRGSVGTNPDSVGTNRGSDKVKQILTRLKTNSRIPIIEDAIAYENKKRQEKVKSGGDAQQRSVMKTKAPKRNSDENSRMIDEENLLYE